MSEISEAVETAVPQESRLNFAMFNKLSPGVQRVVIAALFVSALIIVVILRELVKSNAETTGGQEDVVTLGDS
jgi:hypothetical protein